MSSLCLCARGMGSFHPGARAFAAQQQCSFLRSSPAGFNSFRTYLDLMCVLVYVWEVAEKEEACGGGAAMSMPREVGRMAAASRTTAGSLDATTLLWFWLQWKEIQPRDVAQQGALCPHLSILPSMASSCPPGATWKCFLKGCRGVKVLMA